MINEHQCKDCSLKYQINILKGAEHTREIILIKNITGLLFLGYVFILSHQLYKKYFKKSVTSSGISELKEH